jgi:peptidyl-prolyl cis-trans isomerase SurA
MPFVGPRAERPSPTVAAGTPSPPPAARNEKPAPASPVVRNPVQVGDDVLDRVVAVVNNDVITLTELHENVLYYKIETRPQDTESDEQIAHRLLSRLIESRLQLQEADRERIGVDETELTEELSARMKKFNASTEEEFDRIVKKQGLTIEALKKKLREQLMITKVVRRKVAFRVSVTEQEVDRYLQDNREKLETGLTYHARHILIAPARERDDAAWAAAHDRALGVYARLLAGEDFAEVAKEVSQDGTAKDGGDLGTLKRGELAEDIESQILKLKPAQVGKPFRTDLGFHIVKLEARDSLEGEGLARARQQIRDILFRQKYQARFDAWLSELKQRAIIEVRI